jgi:hypothetical protein
MACCHLLFQPDLLLPASNKPRVNFSLQMHHIASPAVTASTSAAAEEYNSLYLAEPDFVSELVALVQCEEAVDDEDLRTLALRALAAQLHDRSRSSSVITAITSGGQSGLLSMLLHKSIASILQQADVPLVPSGSGVLPADVPAGSPAAAGSSQAAAGSSSGAVAAAAAPPAGSVQYSVAFVDALLTAVAALVQSTSGCQALNDAGVISALLPLLRDTHADHLGLVCASLKILEAYMDLSQPAATTFRDLGGLTEVIKRTAAEVGVLPGGGAGSGSGAAASAGGAAAAADGDVVMAAAEQRAGQAGSEQQQATGQAPAGGAAAPAAPKQVCEAIVLWSSAMSWRCGVLGCACQCLQGTRIELRNVCTIPARVLLCYLLLI